MSWLKLRRTFCCTTKMSVGGKREKTMPQSGGHGITVSSLVQVDNPPRYGVVRWIGTFPGSDELLAGVELDEPSDNCGDGTFQGVEYFRCLFGHAHFPKLKDVYLDERFGFEIIDTPPGTRHQIHTDNPLQYPPEEQKDQRTVPPVDRYIGDQRGIQGHYNSCYLDSTLFGLFALTNVFDSIFLVEPASEADGDPSKAEVQPHRQAVSDLLSKKIVNPLRKNGVVRFESVMELRTKIEELGKMEGILKVEKDPEEFLNMLFKHILHTKAFFSIRRPFGTEEEFFIQLFTAVDETLRLPTLRVLVKNMFDEGQMSLTAIPSRLFIQVPRYGREFKTFQRIVPDLKFEVSELAETSSDAPECMICGGRSSWECYECKEEFICNDSAVCFCETCSTRVHSKPSRKDHHVERITGTHGTELDLLSVICIETSHYVCFTRELSTNKWIFFDSMADRINDTYNIPKVTDCSDELNEWVYSGDRTRLMSTKPRQLPELVRRFTQDVYMCVYVQPDVAMGGDSDGEKEETELPDPQPTTQYENPDDV